MSELGRRLIDGWSEVDLVFLIIPSNGLLEVTAYYLSALRACTWESIDVVESYIHSFFSYVGVTYFLDVDFLCSRKML